MGSGWKSFEVFARNMGIKSDSGEISVKHEERVIGDEEAEEGGVPCRDTQWHR